ncbi:hypothetical protein AVEN_115671-1, partial [Araneus ventricosus]
GRGEAVDQTPEAHSAVCGHPCYRDHCHAPDGAQSFFKN